MKTLTPLDDRVDEIRTALIVRDAKLQVRKKLDEVAIKRYAEVIKAGHRLPPITVALVDGMHLLVDGWHRLEALGARETVHARVVVTTRDDAAWMAATANLEHGVQLKPSELRNVFRVYVQTGRHRKRRSVYKSYREIGAELGKPHTTIRNWMKHDFPKIAARMGGDGNVGEGGLQPLEPEVLDEAERILGELRETFQTSSDTAYRGHIIAEVRLALADMVASGGWTERPAPDF